MSSKRSLVSRALFPLAVLLLASPGLAQTSTFTYQGRLTDGGTPATGVYDLQFALFDSPIAGSQIGSTQTAANVSVSAGLFTVPLDFGAAALTGANRFLEIGVRLAGGGAFTTLSSRQQITSTPYAVRSANASLADSATNATQLGGQPASQYVLTGDARLGDARSPSAGSSNYVQNTTSPQASTNFNISGNGTLATLSATGAINTATQYNIAGNRVLSVAGTDNTFAGINAGQANAGGSENSFFGRGAGFANTTGANNSFFGYQAGQGNTSGDSNSFFGPQVGVANTTGRANSFFGIAAGQHNTTASYNSFFGSSAGFSNTTGEQNSFFGVAAGESNKIGTDNSFFGFQAGNQSTSNFNSFFGSGAGAVTTSDSDSFFGAFAGKANTTGENNSFFGVAAGAQNVSGLNNSFFGLNAGLNNLSDDNSFFGAGAGALSIAGHQNTFVGRGAGLANSSGDNNTIIGASADLASANLNFATAVGAGAVVSTSNTIALGRADGSDFVVVSGLLTIPNLAVAGSTQLCRNSFNRVGTCSSSLRYKKDLAPYRGGLSVVNRLRPISFTWKDGGLRDLGFGAEDVEQIDPLLVTYNKQGQVEGVKYDRINVVLVNAMKEQQDQLEKQQQQIKRQQFEIEELRLLVCGRNSRARLCKK